VFVGPLPAFLVNAIQTFTTEQRTYNGAKQFCVSTSKPSAADQPSRPRSLYCFDPATGFLQTNIYEDIERSVSRTRPVHFQGHLIPGDLEVQSAGKVAFSAHLDSIEPITTVDEAAFVPPPDASTSEIIMVGQKGKLIGMSGPYPNGANGDFSISGGVAQGLLVQKTPPVYPPVAKAARVEGTVVLQARIAKDGSIAELKVISGHPTLTQAAIDAVKQWVYRPYLLNGNPIEILTTVNVVFALGQPPKPPSPNP